MNTTVTERHIPVAYDKRGNPVWRSITKPANGTYGVCYMVPDRVIPTIFRMARDVATQQRLGCLPAKNSMTTAFPALFPENGLRTLSAKALACTLPKDNKPTCSGQVFVGIFFDGTGNSHDKDHVKPPEKLKETV